MLPTRDLRTDDAEIVSALHLSAFSGFFLSELGESFLVRYYRAIAESNEIGIVGTSDNHIAGFVVGVEDASRFYRKLLLRQGFWFALAALPAVLLHPRFVLRIVENVGLRLRRRPASMKHQRPVNGGLSERVITLTSIAVHPSFRGHQVGAALVQAFLERAKERGAQLVALETDAVRNDQVRRFYARQGFIEVGHSFTHAGRELVHCECRFVEDSARLKQV